MKSTNKRIDIFIACGVITNDSRRVNHQQYRATWRIVNGIGKVNIRPSLGNSGRCVLCLECPSGVKINVSDIINPHIWDWKTVLSSKINPSSKCGSIYQLIYNPSINCWDIDSTNRCCRDKPSHCLNARRCRLKTYCSLNTVTSDTKF